MATAIIPRGLDELARFFKVPLNQDGFFLEAHMKLRPVDFATDGVFVAGLAHYPKPIDESIAQAQAAAARAGSVLAKPYVEVEPIASVVDQELCIGCGMCEANCAFGAIRLHEIAGQRVPGGNHFRIVQGLWSVRGGLSTESNRYETFQRLPDQRGYPRRRRRLK